MRWYGWGWWVVDVGGWGVKVGDGTGSGNGHHC